MDNENSQEFPARRAELPNAAIAEFHGRIAALEAKNVELAARLDAAQKHGEVEPYPGFLAHVVHVMQKYHASDLPDDAPKT